VSTFSATRVSTNASDGVIFAIAVLLFFVEYF
jgi:hypothetical protein